MYYLYFVFYCGFCKDVGLRNWVDFSSSIGENFETFSEDHRPCIFIHDARAWNMAQTILSLLIKKIKKKNKLQRFSSPPFL